MLFFQNPPVSFFTLRDILTNPAVAVAAVTVVTAGLAFVTNRNPRWLGLLVTLVVVFGSTLLTAQAASEKITPETVFLATLNSFVVFFSAAGLSSALASGSQTGLPQQIPQVPIAPTPPAQSIGSAPSQAVTATTHTRPNQAPARQDTMDTTHHHPFFKSWW